MIIRNFTIIFILALIVAASVAMKESYIRGWDEQDHSKLIKFSHKFHIQDSGVECEACHYGAKTSKLSGDNILGDHESCKACHEDALNNNCALCHTDPENIVAIPNPERELVFSHETHINKNVKCETCHQGIADVKYASAANMPAMATCVSCHSSMAVQAECATCHTDFTALVPSDHLTGEFKKEHKQLTRLGELEVTCSTCHTESFCQNCHSGIELKEFGSYRNLMSDPSTRISLKDSPRQSKLQSVHDLNYKYTHGIDAKSKRTDCYSCHEQSSFCTECHQSGDFTHDKIRPANHDKPGFKTIGKGTGGGNHAKLAKRDIEYCASCHDVEGADPICMMCHTEQGGVR